MLNRHCIVIPTDRECALPIREFYDEALYAKEKLDLDCCLVVIDTSDDESRSKNWQVINELRKKKEVKIYYFNPADLDAYIDKIITHPRLVNDRDKLSSLLNPEGCSYGAAANRTFLIAASIGSEYLHRRDSDTIPQKINSGRVFPIAQEYRFLGKTVNEIKQKVDIIEYSSPLDSVPVFLVGAGYIGEWSTELKELYDYSPELFYGHFCLTMPDKEKEYVINWVNRHYFEENPKPFTSDKTELVARNGLDIGNHALYRIFHELPVVPAKDVVGADYFHRQILLTLNLPSVYTNRHLVHFHTKERTTLEWFVKHQLRIVKYLAYRPYMHEFFRNIYKNKEKVFDNAGSFNNPIIAESVFKASEIDNNHSRDLILRQSQLMKKVKIEKYQVLYKAIIEQKEPILEELKNDIKDFAFLIYKWKDIIYAAKEIDVDNV